MKSISMRVVVTLMTICLVCATAGSAADFRDSDLSKPSVGSTFIDALVYRPVGLLAIPLGTALFVVTIPFSAFGGNVDQAFDNLVAEPARFTFARPLGEI